MSLVDPVFSYPASAPVKLPGNVQSSEAAQKPSSDELIHTLEDENRQLHAQLEEMKKKLQNQESPQGAPVGHRFEYNLDTNVMRLEGVRTKDFDVKELEVKLPQGGAIVNELLSSFTLSGDGMNMPDNIAIKLKNTPMEVQQARISIPEETITRMTLESRMDALKREGIKSIEIHCEEGNRMVLSGWARKLLPIPFRIEGELSLADGHRAEFHVTDMEAGLLPVPHLIQTIVMSIADSAMSDTSIERKGDSYFIDAAAFLPPNIKVNLTSVRTEKGRLILQGGPPAAAAKAPKPVPKTITMI